MEQYPAPNSLGSGSDGPQLTNLDLLLSANEASDLGRISAIVESIRLTCADGGSIHRTAQGRLIELYPGAGAMRFSLQVPTGTYRGVGFEYRSFNVFDKNGHRVSESDKRCGPVKVNSEHPC